MLQGVLVDPTNLPSVAGKLVFHGQHKGGPKVLASPGQIKVSSLPWLQRRKLRLLQPQWLQAGLGSRKPATSKQGPSCLQILGS